MASLVSFRILFALALIAPMVLGGLVPQDEHPEGPRPPCHREHHEHNHHHDHPPGWRHRFHHHHHRHHSPHHHHEMEQGAKDAGSNNSTDEAVVQPTVEVSTANAVDIIEELFEVTTVQSVNEVPAVNVDTNSVATSDGGNAVDDANTDELVDLSDEYLHPYPKDYQQSDKLVAAH